jgi:hypothetical protein
MSDPKLMLHRTEKVNGLLSRLAKRAGAAANTVSRFEDGLGAMVDTLARIQGTLASAGVIFIPADHTGGPGVRFREAPATRANASFHLDPEVNVVPSAFAFARLQGQA